jgi:hypothetical protein
MNKIISALFATGAVLALGGLVTHLSRWELSPYLYLIGTAMIAIALIFGREKSEDFVVRRLYVQQILGGIFLFGSAVLMFVMHGNEWILALAIACVFLLYTSFRLSYIEKKEGKK